ncbi:penicillin-binding protein 2 [Bacteroidales bacterium OttesenSCG-928-A17]|nr:penicillin-binding protein 2 [Bacteroidales bacterium OttesenSCG-928-A17]
MKKEAFNPQKRIYLIIGIVCVVVLIYLIQLFRLQVVENDYRHWADSNAFYKKTLYPSRGIMYDREGRLLVYNKPIYDVTVIMRETEQFDTLAFCAALNVDIDYFRKRIADIKNRKINPGYSSYTPQTFITQLGNKEYGLLQESIYKFPGFYIENRTTREYDYPNAAHVLGYIAPVDKKDLERDDYYVRGEFLGKTGVEKSYESYLRGEKGVEILLRDARGQIKGKYEEGIHDQQPVSGKDLILSLDMELQAYGEELMRNKLGSIIMIEPSTGEILCMVSSSSYDPSLLIGRDFGKNFSELAKDPYTPLLHRAMNGKYPPGSTFKAPQALVFLQEGIITPNTAYSCHGGFPLGGGRPACHAHYSPIALAPALGTSCNSYFCWGMKAMLENKKYGTIQNALDRWADLMKAQGLGVRLGVDLPSEKSGQIPSSQFYDKWYKDKNGKPWWRAMTIISNSIGQGEVELTPLQICNLAAGIANRGYFYTPHIVKEIKDSSLDSLYIQPRYTGIDRKHYDPIVEGMRMAVTGGTCKGANIPDIEVCGKTGTAQNKGKDHSIFMGFAPMDKPEVAIMVFVENGGYGAEYAVPTGRLMIEKYLKGEISPEAKPTEERIKNAVILRNVVQKN